MGRELDDNNECNFVVSLQNKSIFRCGFSVEDPETFRLLVGKYIMQKGDCDIVHDEREVSDPDKVP